MLQSKHTFAFTMDSNNSFNHERLNDDSIFSDKEWTVYRRKPMLINYGLLILAYILILALFITVLSQHPSGNSHMATISDLNDLRDIAAGLASKVNKMEEDLKKPTCDPEWKKFNGSCYYFGQVKMNWMKARSMCMRKEGDLVVITSNGEQSFLASITDNKRHWIGLSDLDDEGVWKWVDGTDYEKSYKHWKKGEPNDYGQKEDCAHLWISGEWNDVHCTYDQCYAICEKSL